MMILKYRLEILSQYYEIEIQSKNGKKGFLITVNGESFDSDSFPEIPFSLTPNKEISDSYNVVYKNHTIPVILKPLLDEEELNDEDGVNSSQNNVRGRNSGLCGADL